MSEVRIQTLLKRKAKVEKSCSRKQWIWKDALREHRLLECIDGELINLGYYDYKNRGLESQALENRF